MREFSLHSNYLHVCVKIQKSSYCMIDSDQHPDSNQHPLLKSASTPQIGVHSSNRRPLLKSASSPQISIHSSNRRPLLKSASTPQISVHSSNQRPLLKSASTPQISIHSSNTASTPQISVHSSNQRPLLKSASTPQISIHSSNQRPLLKSASTPQINVHSSNQRPLLKSASTPQIGIHWHHYLKSWSDLRIFSNWHPFQILRFDLLVRVRVRAYVSDVIGRRFEKRRNDHRFENWMPIWEFEKGQIWGTDICDVEIGHGLENGRGSEYYMYIILMFTEHWMEWE